MHDLIQNIQQLVVIVLLIDIILVELVDYLEVEFTLDQSFGTKSMLILTNHYYYNHFKETRGL